MMGVPILAVITAVASVLPAAAGIARYGTLSPAMKVFLVLCVMTCLEIAVEFILAYHQINNTALANADAGVETIFIATVYWIALEVKNIRTVIVAIAVIFLFFWAADVLFVDAKGQLDEQIGIVSKITIIALSVIALHTVARRATSSLADSPLFWLTTANILLSTGVVFVLALSNELLAMGVSYFTAAWDINWSLDIIAYILFTKAFFCKAPTAS